MRKYKSNFFNLEIDGGFFVIKTFYTVMEILSVISATSSTKCNGKNNDCFKQISTSAFGSTNCISLGWDYLLIWPMLLCCNLLVMGTWTAQLYRNSSKMRLKTTILSLGGQIFSISPPGLLVALFYCPFVIYSSFWNSYGTVGIVSAISEMKLCRIMNIEYNKEN